MIEYITDDIDISSDVSDEENSNGERYRKSYSTMRLVFIFLMSQVIHPYIL